MTRPLMMAIRSPSLGIAAAGQLIRQAREAEAEISIQEGQVAEVDRQGPASQMDARGDEGHQAGQGQLPNQVAELA